MVPFWPLEISQPATPLNNRTKNVLHVYEYKYIKCFNENFVHI